MASERLNRLKPFMLPIAMLGGILFYPWMGYVQFLSPYLIFTMLFITYCRLDFRHISLGTFQWVLLGVQMLIAAAAYFVLVWANHTVAEGVFICVFIPTATAAPVICAMLGGSLPKLATYSLLCNVFVAVVGPFVLALVGDTEYGFLESFLMILRMVMPLLLGPIVASLLIRNVLPKFHEAVKNHQSVSFYLWAVSLFIIVGGCVSFIINHYRPDDLWTMIWLAFGALVVCLIQFKIGRMVGRRFGDPVSGGQGMGQKNTVLAVWIALAYMNPVASIAPASYIAWQNIINSWQIMRHKSSADPKP
ncbi:MAG: transporter [Muribaculaceae bacterium]|nr:transporter [Muribaculaceae bacterium]